MKRFYKGVSTQQTDGGWRVLLDGRPIRTAGGRPQIVPTQALAQAMAAEWEAQGETIDPARFAFRDLADFAIDAIAPDPQDVVTSLLPYAETDTLCYRADPEDALFARQDAVWEPLLAATEQAHGLRFTRVSGIMHQPQPEQTLAHLADRLAGLDAFTLAALRMLSSLAASMVIALAALEPDADAGALWNAANLEEDWQAQLWGIDPEAAQHRQTRFEAFTLAITFARLAQAD